MLRHFILIGVVIGFVACEAEGGKTTSPQPAAKSTPTKELLTKIQFEKTVHDFGTIHEGEVVTYRFKFKNVGDKPLIISKVKPSCGCTASDYSKDPVPPGEEGYIEVSFNSTGRIGKQNKTVEVFANTEPKVHVLRFTGEVIQKQ